MSLTQIAKVLLGGASIATVLIGVADTSHAQAPQQPQAQATPAKTAKPAAKAKTAPADRNQDEQEPQAAVQLKKKDPAAAQASIDAGIKQLQGGRAEQAIQTFTSAIAGGNLPPPQMARALYHRGVAYRKANKPAQAISDLTSALWLKNGLQDADRQDAVQQRSDAYRDAGLPDQTGEDGRPAGVKQAQRARTATATTGTATTGGTTAAAPVAVASLAPESAAAQPAPTTGNLFASLFGGFNKQAAPAQPAPPKAATPSEPVTSGWSSATTAPATKPAATSALARTASVAAPAAVAAQGAAATSGIHARIALVRTEAEAEAVKSRLQTQHAAALGGLAPTTSQASFGGMGAFVQVRVGPYATVQQAQALCAKLKGSGLDCVPVDR